MRARAHPQPTRPPQHRPHCLQLSAARATAAFRWLASPVAPFVAATLRSERALLERAAAFRAERQRRAAAEDAQLLRAFTPPLHPAAAQPRPTQQQQQQQHGDDGDGSGGGALAAVQVELARLQRATRAVPSGGSWPPQPQPLPLQRTAALDSPAARFSAHDGDSGAGDGGGGGVARAAHNATERVTTEQLVAALAAARVRSRSLGGGGAGPPAAGGTIARRSAELTAAIDGVVHARRRGSLSKPQPPLSLLSSMPAAPRVQTTGAALAAATAAQLRARRGSAGSVPGW